MHKRLIVPALIIAGVTLAFAHPGHEYHVRGTVTKVRAPYFEVDEPKRGTTSFMVVPGTEVFLNDSRATAAEIVTGVQAEVDGVENDKGLVEAKKVKLTR